MEVSNGRDAGAQRRTEDGVGDHSSISPDAKAALRVLVVDDERSLREGCVAVLQRSGYNVTAIARAEDAIEPIKRRKFDILLINFFTNGVTGMELLATALAASPESLVIMTTNSPSVSTNVEAMRAGAWDYLAKPFSAPQLQLAMGRAAHEVIVARESARIRTEIVTRQPKQAEAPAVLGVSAAFREVVDLARRIAPTAASVMISGESGTGKEVIAQLIHRHSRRASMKLVPINCAALPEHLLESEMFGHKKGAFTGADRDKTGLLEVAHRGTLFLDELTEMTLPLQAKLLRVIQDGVLRRVGSEQQDAVVDVRFISATNRDPDTAVRNRVLREDLYYRLRVVPLHIPPLRQRVEDIPILASHFLAHYWSRHREQGDAMPEITRPAMDFLSACPWRGNVRELQNVMEHLAVLAEPGQPVRPDDIPLPTDRGAMVPGIGGLPTHIMNEAYHRAKDEVLAYFEKEYVRRLVARAGGNMSKAARLAHVDRTTLYRLLDKHNQGTDVQVSPRLGEPAVIADLPGDGRGDFRGTEADDILPMPPSFSSSAGNGRSSRESVM